jgi:chromosome segregation ATPase
MDMHDHMDDTSDDNFLMSENSAVPMLSPFPNSNNQRALNFSIQPQLFQHFSLPIAPITQSSDKNVVDDLKKQVETLEERCYQMEVENESLKMKMLNDQVERAKSNGSSGPCTNCSAVKEEISRHKTALNVQVEDNRRLNNEIQNRMKDVHDLEFQLEEMQRLVHQSETNDTGIKSKIAELNREVKNANEAKKKAERELNFKVKEVQNLTEKIDKLEKFNIRLKQREQQETQQLLDKTVEKNVREYKKQTENMQKQLQKYKADESKRETLEQKCADYLKTMTSHEEMIKELIAELDSEKALSSEIDQRLAELLDRYNEQVEICKNQQQREEQLVSNVNELAKHNTEGHQALTQLQERLAATEKELITWRDHCEEYRQQGEGILKKMEKLRSDNITQVDHLKRLDEAYVKQEKELTQYQQEVVDLTTTVQKLNVQNDNLNDQLLEQEERYEITQSELQESENKVNSLQQEIDYQREQNREQYAELDRMMKQVMEHQRMLKEFENLNSDQKSTIFKQNERLQQLEKEKQNFITALTAARDECQKLQISHNSYITQTTPLQSALHSLEAELDKERAKSNKLKTDLRQCELTVLNVSREKDELHREVEELRGNLELFEQMKQRNNKLRLENEKLLNMIDEDGGNSSGCVSEEKLVLVMRDYDKRLEKKDTEIKQLNEDLDAYDQRMHELENERDELLKEQAYDKEQEFIKEINRLRSERDYFKKFAQQQSAMKDITNQQPGSVKKPVMKSFKV